MTRKDYELIASVIDRLGLDLETTDLIANKMAEALEWENPKFNSAKFKIRAKATHLANRLDNLCAGGN